MNQEFNKIEKVKGSLNLPGDKSISHRSVMFSSLAEGKSVIHNLSNGEDVKSTIKCFRQLGCTIQPGEEIITVKGKGFKGFNKPISPLDAGNSGTTSRLISGILIAQDFETTIIGDSSLSLRPMKRIVDPLTEMGGKLKPTEKSTLPMKIFPSEHLKAIEYSLPVASAQIKSAVLLAGLHLDEITQVIESAPSRNHTEVMLNLDTEQNGNKRSVFVSKRNYPEPGEYFIPSDISTAAFFIILALFCDKAELVLKNVSLNNTRTGILTILQKMGAHIEINNVQTKMGESFGDLVVYNSKLKNIDIPEEIIPNIIDEIPILSVAGVFADGDFKIKGAKELRFKETDRINAICINLRKLNLNVDESEDGFVISGNIKNNYTSFESFHDHRIAMAFAVLSSLLDNGGVIENYECVAISNPDFITQLKGIVQ